MKGYSTLPNVLALLECHNEIVLYHIQDTRWVGILSLFRDAVGLPPSNQFSVTKLIARHLKRLMELPTELAYCRTPPFKPTLCQILVLRGE